MEWTPQEIKIYSWTWSKVPANIGSSNIDTSSWGTPSVFLNNGSCNIAKHFANQKLVFSLDFCGAPGGFTAEWDESCSAKTGQSTCIGFVASSPSTFANTYFKIQDIRYFKQS